MELLRIQTQSPTNLRRQRSHMDDHPEDFLSDDDDARSVSTVVPHELERVEEEDEEQLAAEEEEERRARRDELRPRTPEPTGMGMHEDDDEHDAMPSHAESSTSQIRTESPPPAPPVSDELVQRLTTLSVQLESALELSRSLQQQHSTAQSTISLLESKVTSLESLVQATQLQVHAQAETQQQLAQAVEDTKAAATSVREPAAPVSSVEDEQKQERESITDMLNQWKKNVEGRWSSVQEEWNEERDRLRRAREEWEARVRVLESGLETTVAKVDSGLASMTSFQVQQRQQLPNGHAKLTGSGGLVTPPSPRSLSAESTRPRQKKRRTSSARGRSRSRSRSESPDPAHVNGESGHDHDEVSSTSSQLRRRPSWATDDSSISDEARHGNGSAKTMDGEEVRLTQTMQFPTPEPSLSEQPISGRMPAALTEARPKEPPAEMVSAFSFPVLGSHVVHSVLPAQPVIHSYSAAFGIVLVAAAAAAVMWRVKPDGS